MSIGGIGNIVAMLGSGAKGYMQGRQARIDQDAELADQQFKADQQQQQRDQWQRDATLRGDLSSASQPVTMATTPSLKPDTMDNADVGQVGEQPVMPNTFKVGNQSFTDQSQADKALAAANSPTGQADRVSAAYMKAGQAPMAMQVQRNAQEAELARLGLQQKHMEIANQEFDNMLGQQNSHDALASFVSNSAHDGQGGGLKLQAVPSQDGKSVTYNRVNDDGSLTPTGHTYTNDDAGLQQAQLWLSRNTPLSAKIGNLHQQFTDKLAAQKEASEALERTARGKYYEMMGEAAGVKADKAGSKQTPFEKMDEVDSLAFKGYIKSQEDVDAAITKGIADGSIKEGDPQFMALQKRRLAAGMSARAIVSKYGGAGTPGADPMGRGSGGYPYDAASDGAAPADFSGLQGPGRAKALADIAASNPSPSVRMQAIAALAGNSAPPPVPVAAPVVAAERVPDPPPQVLMSTIGAPGGVSPAYAQWQKQYGEAYAQQQAADAAVKAAKQVADAKVAAALIRQPIAAPYRGFR